MSTLKICLRNEEIPNEAKLQYNSLKFEINTLYQNCKVIITEHKTFFRDLILIASEMIYIKVLLFTFPSK